MNKKTEQLATIVAVFFTAIILFFLMLTMCAGKLEGQEVVSDTILVTVIGNVSEVTLTVVPMDTVPLGDTLVFHATVVDEEGDPMIALIEFFVEDPTALRLEAITDSEVPLSEGSARGIGLRKASTRVWVMATPITELRIASFRPPDSLNWSRRDTIIHREGQPFSLQLCAYLLSGDHAVSQSSPPPRCPFVFPFVERPAEFPVPPIPHPLFNRFASVLEPKD
jgi:hypothetical protein